MTDDAGGHLHGSPAAGSIGRPGQAADSTRTIDLVAQDSLRFDPEALEVAAGETVTLRVKNAGTLPHDFFLGDEAAQRRHEDQMATMGPHAESMPDEPDGFVVPPGQTKQLVWTFGAPGEVIYGCHTPGHYPAGMRGRVTVR
jgi:uncharacterized cupredoxin-like copper-binding protein